MAQPRRHPVRATDDFSFAGFDWMRLTSRTPSLTAGANKLSLLAGLTAGLAYSTFASFVANALTPVSGYLVEGDSFRRAVSGHYQEVLSLNGAISTVLVSLIVFVLVWWTTRVILENWQSSDGQRIESIGSSLSSDGGLLTPVTIAPLAVVVTK